MKFKIFKLIRCKQETDFINCLSNFIFSIFIIWRVFFKCEISQLHINFIASPSSLCIKLNPIIIIGFFV